MSAAPSEVLLNTANQQSNQIKQVSEAIEGLDKDSIYKQIGDVENNKSFDNFKLGGLLSVAQTAKWYKEDGYANFKDFLAETFPTIEYRKAKYLVDMYNSLVAAEVDWDSVKDIGWTKLSRLAVVIDKDNAEMWFDKARDLTTIELLEYIKTAKKLSNGEVPGDMPSDPVVKKNFALHVDQQEVVEDALTKAKLEADTEFDSVALDAICQNYLSGESVSAPSNTLRQQMEEAGYDEVFNLVEAIWPNLKVTVAMTIEEDA